MLKAYKTEISPTAKQAWKIRQTLGICRYLYNLYLASNFEVYETLGKGFFVTAYTFDKYVNHVVKKEFPWVDECGAKARKQALMNAERAFKNFMQGKAGRPKFKKKREQKVKAYFPKNAKGDWTIWRHKLQIPTIGVVRLKEKGYLPPNTKVRSGTISYKAGRYYVSVLVEVPEIKPESLSGEGIGIDLGVKELAVLSTGKVYGNINKTRRVRQLKKRLRREQRKLSRRLEGNIAKRDSANRPQWKRPLRECRNIERQNALIRLIYKRLTDIRNNYLHQVTTEIVKTKPSRIVMEDLNVSGMMRNRHLSRAIA